ncbi:MAG TPA: hypothetical protein VJR05_06000, partial [Acidimicrobiia bacterium]|nr:hypothetical protein [Acidimicrobiia bacterium]
MSTETEVTAPLDAAPEPSPGDEPQPAVAEPIEEPTPAPASRPAVIVPPSVDSLPDDIGDDFEAAIAQTVVEFKEGDIVE